MITKRIKVNIPEDSKISDFEPILSLFSNWTQFKREIKLSSILEGKKIEYLIEDISPLDLQNNESIKDQNYE